MSDIVNESKDQYQHGKPCNPGNKDPCTEIGAKYGVFIGI